MTKIEQLILKNKFSFINYEQQKVDKVKMIQK